MEFVDPKIDIAFKKIFGDSQKKHILISLLNAVMEKNIVEVEILNPYQLPKLPELKYTVLDIRAKDKNGEEYIVEMQANPYAFFDKRALDYLSRAYAAQLTAGQDYKEHRPVYFIGVLNFNYFNSKNYLSKHSILNVETHEQEICDFELYFLELTKFKKDLSQLTTILDKWTFFLKEIHSYNHLPDILAAEKAISDAAFTAQRSTWTQQELDAYYNWQRETAKELDYIKALKAREQELKAKEQELKAKEQELKVQDKTLAEKEAELKSNKEKQHLAVMQLHERKIAPSDIAQILGLTEKEVLSIISK